MKSVNANNSTRNCQLNEFFSEKGRSHNKNQPVTSKSLASKTKLPIFTDYKSALEE